jgi:hypothetical protein
VSSVVITNEDVGDSSIYTYRNEKSYIFKQVVVCVGGGVSVKGVKHIRTTVDEEVHSILKIIAIKEKMTFRALTCLILSDYAYRRKKTVEAKNGNSYKARGK